MESRPGRRDHHREARRHAPVRLAVPDPILNGSGEVVGAVNMLVDISERKRAEDALREADRRKDEFLATLAHELRNPLAPLRNSLQIMRLAGDDIEPVEKARLVMERQLGQMIRLIDDLLDLSRISQGKIELRRERIELEAVRDAVDISRQPLRPGRWIGWERRWRRFCELARQRRQYTESGGHIRVGVERQNSNVTVAVKITAPVSQPTCCQRSLNVYSSKSVVRESQGGLGIGLNIVQRLVMQWYRRGPQRQP
jgi:signal transduction histidine kinase